MKEKKTPHIIAAAGLAVFIVLCVSCMTTVGGQLSPNASQSVLNIRRGDSGTENGKKMEVYVDGRKDSATIANGQQGSLLVMNGLHNIYVKIGKYQSQMLTFDPQSEVVEFFAHFEGSKGLFSNTLQLNLTKTSGATGKIDTSTAASQPVINIQVDNSSSNTASSSGNSSTNTNSTVGTDNSVH